MQHFHIKTLTKTYIMIWNKITSQFLDLISQIPFLKFVAQFPLLWYFSPFTSLPRSSWCWAYYCLSFSLFSCFCFFYTSFSSCLGAVMMLSDGGWWDGNSGFVFVSVFEGGDRDTAEECWFLDIFLFIYSFGGFMGFLLFGVSDLGLILTNIYWSIWLGYLKCLFTIEFWLQDLQYKQRKTKIFIN